jgi:hypothetical protein
MVKTLPTHTQHNSPKKALHNNRFFEDKKSGFREIRSGVLSEIKEEQFYLRTKDNLEKTVEGGGDH